MSPYRLSSRPSSDIWTAAATRGPTSALSREESRYNLGQQCWLACWQAEMIQLTVQIFTLVSYQVCPKPHASALNTCMKCIHATKYAKKQCAIHTLKTFRKLTVQRRTLNTLNECHLGVCTGVCVPAKVSVNYPANVLLTAATHFIQALWHVG